MSVEFQTGWLNLVALEYSVAVDHYTPINLTKFDVLDQISPIRMAVAYRTVNGEELTSFPTDLSLPKNCTVNYIDLKDWKCSTQKARSWTDLPMEAKEYIEFIETSMGVSIYRIAVGADREDMIVRERF